MATARDAMVNLKRTRVDALSLPLPRVLAGAQRQVFVCLLQSPSPQHDPVHRSDIVGCYIFELVVSETRCNRFAAHRSKSATSNHCDDHHTSGK